MILLSQQVGGDEEAGMIKMRMVLVTIEDKGFCFITRLVAMRRLACRRRNRRRRTDKGWKIWKGDHGGSHVQ